MGLSQHLDTLGLHEVLVPYARGFVSDHDRLSFGGRQRVRDDCLVTEDRPVEVVLPLLMRVFGRESNALLASNCRVDVVRLSVNHWVKVFQHVQVPHADDEIAELAVALELRVDDSVVFGKIFNSDDLLTLVEVLVGAVQRSEQVKEIETGHIRGLDAAQHVRVPRGVKLGFDLIKFKHTILVDVQVTEGLLDKSESLGLQLLNQIVQEHLVLDLSHLLVIINFKGHSELTRLHVSDLKVIKGL